MGGQGNDPAEEAVLVSAGYSGMLAAGVTGATGGWLVEIYTDSISLPSPGFEPVLRALLALAVTGATEQLTPVAAPPMPSQPGKAVTRNT